DRYALRRWQGDDGIGGSVDGQVAFDVLAGLVTRVPDVAEQIEGFGGPRPGDPVQRSAGDDLVQPGGEAGIRFEPGKLLPGRDERFLGDVLSVVMVAEQPQCDTVS